MITLVFSGEMSANRRDVFERAAAFWDRVIDTAFDPIRVGDDLLHGVQINASIAPIDGADGVLGQAGPTMLLPGSELPATGIMAFDADDIARLEGDGSFADVILHEMAHVLGFGTLWARRGLIAGAGGVDPRFTGTAAAREFRQLEPTGGLTPVANTGGAGTREGHWRELVFGDELLTGFLSGTHRPLSRVSVASFEDLGYAVDYSVADPFVLPTFRQLALLGIPEAVRICDLCRVDRPEPVVMPPGGV